MNIILSSDELMVTKVLKTTKAKLFQNLSEGSVIRLSVPVERAGSRRGNTYPTYIRVEHIQTGEVVGKSFNELPPILGCFEFIELSDDND